MKNNIEIERCYFYHARGPLSLLRKHSIGNVTILEHLDLLASRNMISTPLPSPSWVSLSIRWLGFLVSIWTAWTLSRKHSIVDVRLTIKEDLDCSSSETFHPPFESSPIRWLWFLASTWTPRIGCHCNSCLPTTHTHICRSVVGHVTT